MVLEDTHTHTYTHIYIHTYIHIEVIYTCTHTLRSAKSDP